MRIRLSFLFGIAAGGALVVYGPPPLPSPPFWPDLVTCYRIIEQPTRVATVIPVLQKTPRSPNWMRLDEDDIVHIRERIAPMAEAADQAADSCTPLSCSVSAQNDLMKKAQAYFRRRQRLTTDLFERRGEAAVNVMPFAFNSPTQIKLKQTLKELEDNGQIKLAELGRERWIAALFIRKSDGDIRPCTYKGP